MKVLCGSKASAITLSFIFIMIDWDICQSEGMSQVDLYISEQASSPEASSKRQEEEATKSAGKSRRFSTDTAGGIAKSKGKEKGKEKSKEKGKQKGNNGKNGMDSSKMVVLKVKNGTFFFH